MNTASEPVSTATRKHPRSPYLLTITSYLVVGLWCAVFGPTLCVPGVSEEVFPAVIGVSALLMLQKHKGIRIFCGVCAVAFTCLFINYKQAKIERLKKRVQFYEQQDFERQRRAEEGKAEMQSKDHPIPPPVGC